MTHFNLVILLVVLSFFRGEPSFGWGKDGHEIIASTAAEVLVRRTGIGFLKSHEFDLGYYANVPDLIWKNLSDNVFKMEHPLHFVDWNASMQSKFRSPLLLPADFKEYEEKMGADYDRERGLSPWRIKQFVQLCGTYRSALGANTLKPEERMAGQLKLLVCLGELAHYVGDLSQPLHVTENHDGQRTGQKGVHAFFEVNLVNELEPELRGQVLKETLARFENKVSKSEAPKTPDLIVRELMNDSFKLVDELLRRDKKSGRSHPSQVARINKKFLTERLVQGALATALIWHNLLNASDQAEAHHLSSWSNNWIEENFYNFEPKPEYVAPDFESGKSHES